MRWRFIVSRDGLMCPWWWTAGIWSYRTALYIWLALTGALTVGTSMYADLDTLTYAGAAVGAVAGALAYSASCYLGRYQAQRLKSARIEAAARAVAETYLVSDRDYVSACPRSHARLMIRSGVCLSASTGRSLYYRMQGAGLIVTRQGRDYYDLLAIGRMLRQSAEACHSAPLSGVCATVTSSRRDA